MAKSKKPGKSGAKGKDNNQNNNDTGKSGKGSKSSHGKKHKSRMMDVSGDDYKFRKSLETDGMSIADMSADGNCLFRALSDQLYGDYGNYHEEIRSDICDYMEENKDDFKVFLVLDDDSCDEGDDGKDFESYIRTMRQDGEWGGNLELVAAARLYERKITVFSATLSAYSIEPGAEKPSGPDLLVSFHDNDHYNSVRDEKSPPKPPPNRNKLKLKKTYHKVSSEASDSTASTATTSISEVSIDNKPLDVKADLPKKAVKKSDPCPCGSGQRYKKCCLAKDKHATRIGKIKAESLETEEKADEEVIMKGNFRVLQI